MQNNIEYPPSIKFREAVDNIIKLSDTPKGATAYFELDDLSHPSPVPVRIGVFFDGKEVAFREAITPVVLPFEVVVDRGVLLSHVEKRVDITYRFVFGPNVIQSPSDIFEIRHS
jgi:hypothetical protein